MVDLDFFLPAYNETDHINPSNIWFCVDTSGSMHIKEIGALFKEIEKCLSQMGNMKGKLSFFDDKITEPEKFYTIEEVRNIRPVGGGGTDFGTIFQYMKKYMIDDLPTAIIIMTDGCAYVPPEKDALGVPVLWAVIDNSGAEIPWGKVIHVGL